MQDTYRKQVGELTLSDNVISANALDVLAKCSDISLSYDPHDRMISLSAGSHVTTVDCTDFIKDGMLSTAELCGSQLVLTFNTDAREQPISIQLSNLADGLATSSMLSDYLDKRTGGEVSGNIRILSGNYIQTNTPDSVYVYGAGNSFIQAESTKYGSASIGSRGFIVIGVVSAENKVILSVDGLSNVNDCIPESCYTSAWSIALDNMLDAQFSEISTVGADYVIFKNALKATASYDGKELTAFIDLLNKKDDNALYCPTHPEVGNLVIPAFTSNHVEGGSTHATAQFAHAEGRSTFAEGRYSHAEGHGTLAAGTGAHVEGMGSKALENRGVHAEGWSTVSFGNYGSHSEGCETSALGTNGSHAEGYQTRASDVAAHAEGVATKATGRSSHAEGYKSEATNYGAHAEGGNYNRQIIGGKATGIASHAEGLQTTASAQTAHAEGEGTYATSQAAHSEGYQTSAMTAVAAHAEGAYTKASGNSSHAEGKWSYSIGTGAHAEGISCVANGSTDGAHAEGFAVSAIGVGSHAEGYRTLANEEGSHAEGRWSYASGKFAHAEGGSYNGSSYLSGGWAAGNGSHAEGLQTYAKGTASHAEGYATSALTAYSHAEGVQTFANGQGSHAEGLQTSAIGNYSHAGGISSIANASDSYANGVQVSAMNYRTIALGYKASTTQQGQFVWNGYTSAQTSYIPSNTTQGSFNINPTSGINGFYIGSDNFIQCVLKAVQGMSDAQKAAFKTALSIG